ncbi:hypothetical protein BR93DRAFT_342247 [Coniochaeta sp. PMI_546]|nr:hypothetical protein BR93DRAFT_342247 [Coniochaeta sp. PMI_546]
MPLITSFCRHMLRIDDHVPSPFSSLCCTEAMLRNPCLPARPKSKHLQVRLDTSVILSKGP